MIFFSCAKGRLPCHASIDFFRNEQYTSAGSFSSSRTRKRSVSSIQIIPPQILTTESLCWRVIPTEQLSPLKIHLFVKPSGSFGNALDSSVRGTAFMFVIMHFHDHSMHKSLFPGAREGILIILFIEAIIAMEWLLVVYAFFCSLASLKIIPFVVLGALGQVFPINLYHALKIRLNHRNQTDVSSLKDFSKNPYTFPYFCHHTAIYSSRNCFICFGFGYFFYNKEFFAFYKVFSTFYLAWRIVKLIARTTSILEERLDFEITWLIWNANNATMSPPWPKNIHLYSKDCCKFRTRDARILHKTNIMGPTVHRWWKTLNFFTAS